MTRLLFLPSDSEISRLARLGQVMAKCDCSRAAATCLLTIESSRRRQSCSSRSFWWLSLGLTVPRLTIGLVAKGFPNLPNTFLQKTPIPTQWRRSRTDEVGYSSRYLDGLAWR